jgi:hypothetical protein
MNSNCDSADHLSPLHHNHHASPINQNDALNVNKKPTHLFHSQKASKYINSNNSTESKTFTMDRSNISFNEDANTYDPLGLAD